MIIFLVFNYTFDFQTLLYGANSGYLLDKLRNKRRKQNRIEELDTEQDSVSTIHCDEELDLVQFFKNCIIRTEIDKLEEKLRTSVEVRRLMLQHPMEPIHKTFPFYFLEPKLVRSI